MMVAIRPISEYLGKPVRVMLQEFPFRNWSLKRSSEIEIGDPIVHYEFPGHGLELRCDFNDTITVIFLTSSGLADANGGWLGFSVPDTQKGMRERFGAPKASGIASTDPVLGRFGPWDKFEYRSYYMHAEYASDGDSIKRLTFIWSESETQST